MSSGDESDYEPMSTKTLEDICDGTQYHPSINRIEARYKIRDHIKLGQQEQKVLLLSTQNLGTYLQKLIKAVVSEISQALPIFGESGSEVSHFIPEPINFVEVTRLSECINKPWLKATLKDVKNLINNQNFLVKEEEQGEPVTPCMDV